MNWFYAFQGQQVGPVEDNELARLVSVGTITGATLVWHSGMPNWLPYAQIQPAGVAGQTAPPFAGPGADQAQCSQCGIVLPTDEIVQVEGFNVCGACKPILLQKLRQGVSPAIGAHGLAPFRYAGFWIRFAALLLDGLIMSPVTVLIAVAAYFLYPAAITYNPEVGFLPQVIYQVLAFSISAAYSIFFVGRYGATPGKMVCELRIVRPDRSRLTYGRATGRFFALFVSYLVGYIIAAVIMGICVGIGFALGAKSGDGPGAGFIALIGIGVVLALALFGLPFYMAGFDAQKRTVHDYIADTRVIYK